MRGFYFGNPVVVYGALWLAVLALVNLRLTAILNRLADQTVWLVLGNIATFAVAYVVLKWLWPPHRVPSLRFRRDMILLNRFVRPLLWIWVVGSVVEIAIFGGMPITWILTGDGRTYADFGIPTVHGLFTAIYLFCLTALFLEYCLWPRTRRGVRSLTIVGLLFIWPVLQVNRGVGVWALLEMLGVYLLVRRISFTRLLRGVGVLLIAVLMFGVIGDFRSAGSVEGLRSMVTEDAQYMNKLPSGFLWVYLYVTAPLNNLNRAIAEGMPAEGQLYFSTVNLLPTVIRVLVYNNPDRRYPVQLVNTSFNTSTWYSGYLVDFGIWWALTAAAILQGIACWAYLRARQRHVWAVLAYAALFQGFALSIFADTFTSLVTLGQVLLALYFHRWARAHAFRPVPRTATPDRGAFDRPSTAPA